MLFEVFGIVLVIAHDMHREGAVVAFLQAKGEMHVNI
jgi:hypothetical protein